jgi:hypothetical protein
MKLLGRLVAGLFKVLVLSALGLLMVRPAVRAQGPAPIPPHPLTQLPQHKVTPAQLLAWEKELSNWGRWGPNDQRGTLNLITQAKSLAALRLAKEGISASLHHFVEPKTTIDNNNMNVEFKHWNTTVDPKSGKPQGALDAITFAIHDGGDTHMDALCHYPVESTRGKVQLNYNGYQQELLPEGCGILSIDKMGKGYLTRGILVDMPLLKGVEWMEARTPIFVSDLEAWEKFAKIKIGSGDAVFIRTGRWARRAKTGPWNAARETPGLHASVLPWIKQRDVAVLSGEGVVDAQPSGVDGWNRPIHSIAITIMGLPMVDNGYFEDVAAIAARLKRWEFMVSWATIQVPNGTASPFTALATF